MRNSLGVIFAVCCSLMSGMALALPDDQNQPIHIAADKAQINDKTGITIYTGNVIITQGSILIEGDQVELYRKDGNVDKVIAKGKPAHFRQKNTATDPFTDAWGLHMVYLINTRILTITEQAKVIQGSDTFTGQKIDYDISRSLVNAFGGTETESGSGRVQMIIQPKQSSETP
ncbi:lipopolysaccharide transport periplasmic protein LptA [Neptuniibacter sp. CAU 1671]|uniref:lipopolysaccharide transport periplasmic protein LptA n=1 Tax=Neptuniibacter sp. CAU 1671 TaxID=3032593 RepID=UPI0023DBB322|nr:lipopolysaccharide transport periplasmic protein LptA [Neptuniibacter sp. CAU 1671]MDF2182187.1 lipopolysaccharide transport periplasmic protein LptA [Neptuniibacter sp. CAU 1671]